MISIVNRAGLSITASLQTLLLYTWTDLKGILCDMNSQQEAEGMGAGGGSDVVMSNLLLCNL